jgi:hypothetical protein
MKSGDIRNGLIPLCTGQTYGGVTVSETKAMKEYDVVIQGGHQERI